MDTLLQWRGSKPMVLRPLLITLGLIIATVEIMHTAQAMPEPQCLSSSKLAVVSTVVAKDGKSKELLDMAAAVPGPLCQQEGCMYFNLASNGSAVKLFEAWTSVRTGYNSMYVLPTARSVFDSEAFLGLVESLDVEGPFQALVPCSEAEQEALPITIPVSVTIDAPIDCIWARVDNWTQDASYLAGKKVTPSDVSPYLRTVHFGNRTVLQLRQAPPFESPPPQPPNGHRLIYYMLLGGNIDTICESYRGEIAITPSAANPSKTDWNFQATVVARSPNMTDALHTEMVNELVTAWPAYLQQWGKASCTSSPHGPSATEL